jgi:hypothetical protein
MLKKIDGLWYMTGTSENSLYPVVLWDEASGFHVGVRLDLTKHKENENMGLAQFYARVQFFDAQGHDIEFDFKIAAKFLHGMELKLASDRHMSATLGSGMIQLQDPNAYKAVEAWQAAFKGFATKLAKKHFISRINDDASDQIIAERFKDVFGLGSVAKKSITDIAKDEEADLDSIESKLGQTDKPFDFKDFLSKKG